MRIEEKVNKEYYVGFDLKITKHTSDYWRNIIHLTTGGNHGRDGSRIPGIWLTHDNKLYVSSSVNGNTDFVYKHDLQPLAEEVWYKIEVEQVLHNNEVGKPYCMLNILILFTCF